MTATTGHVDRPPWRPTNAGGGTTLMANAFTKAEQHYRQPRKQLLPPSSATELSSRALRGGSAPATACAVTPSRWQTRLTPWITSAWAKSPWIQLTSAIGAGPGWVHRPSEPEGQGFDALRAGQEFFIGHRPTGNCPVSTTQVRGVLMALRLWRGGALEGEHILLGSND